MYRKPFPRDFQEILKFIHSTLYCATHKGMDRRHVYCEMIERVSTLIVLLQE